MRKSQPTLPTRKSLVTIYKSFIRPHLDHGDVVYDRALNELFHQSLESFQYSAAIAITETILGTSSEKLSQELGLETLKSKCWLRKENSTAYLFQLIPENSTSYTTRRVQKSQLPFFKTKTNFFKNYFFPAVIMEWNKIDVNIRNSASCNVFKSV